MGEVPLYVFHYYTGTSSIKHCSDQNKFFSGLDARENQLDNDERKLSSPGLQPGDREHDRGSRRGCVVTVSVSQ